MNGRNILLDLVCMHSKIRIDEMQALLPDDDCFAIRQAARRVSQLYDRHLAQVGLTTTQYSILSRIKRAAPMTMKKMADEMVMERTTLVRAIQPLQRDGLLLSRSAAGKGRELAFSLTEAGEARHAAARIRWHAAQEEFERRFGTQRAASLRRELFDLTKA
jgi:DNA-binding MarR family transcriptional regulator